MLHVPESLRRSGSHPGDAIMTEPISAPPDAAADVAQLAGGLVHEIRNPLSTISLNLELLIEELDEPDTPRDRRLLGKLQAVQKECRRLEDILNAFLEFLRSGAIEPQNVDLNSVVLGFLEFLKPLADERRVSLVPHLAGDLPLVSLDTRLWRTVLENLCRNAFEAMPAGGQLELITQRRGEDVELQIIDTGAGMDRKTRERMFEPFFSSKPSGSGLGLPTVRRVVEAHCGRLDCDSEPGRGTRWRITLPAADAV